MTARCSRAPAIPSYYVVMQDYGNRGLEGISQPELTRQNVIDRIKAGEYQRIVFIHFIDDGMVDDVTAELLDAAELELKVEAREQAERLRADRIAWVNDYKRDLRKHEVA